MSNEVTSTNDTIITLTITEGGAMDLQTNQPGMKASEIRGILHAYSEHLWMEDIIARADKKYMSKMGLVDAKGEKM